MLILVLATLLPLCSFTKNILITTPWTGGHFSVPLNIAATLADAGHNVTFLALQHDTLIPVPGNVNYVVAGNIPEEIRSLEYLNEVAVASGALDGPSDKLISRSIVGNAAILEETLEQIKIRFDYYFGTEMDELLRSTNFDLMLVEETVYHPIATIARRLNVPLVTIISVVDQQRAKHEQNLPALLTSEASQFLNIHRSVPPTFLERVELFVELGSFVFNLVPGIMDLMSGYLKKEGLNGLTDLDNMTQLYLVNDHPALSFPNLKAPNSLNIAGLGFRKSPEPLTSDIVDFMEKSQRMEKQIVFVSLGTVAFSSDHYKTMFGTEFFATFVKLGLAVIVRSDKAYAGFDDVLSKSWLPQRSLLESSAISLFVSSCGNNAKIEAVLYKVPVLCIPLFTDQYFNSLLVTRNNFGEMLTREDFSYSALQSLVVQMLDNKDMYKRRTNAASHAVLDDPATPESSLVFHCNQLLEFGNLKYLKNDVIMKQSAVEINNLDVLALVVILGIIFLVFVCLILKIVFACLWEMFIGKGKIKTQ